MKKKMEILYATRPIAPPWNEGSKNLAWQLARNLRLHKPHLLTVAGTAPPAAGDIRWEPIFAEETLTVPEKIRLLRYLLRSHPNIDLYHFLFVPTLPTSLLLRSVVNRRDKLTVQTVPSLPRIPLNERSAQWLFFADRVVVYTKYTAERLEEVGLDNVVHISAGVDTRRLAEHPSDEMLRSRLAVDDDAVLILFSGEYSRLGAVERLKAIMPRVVNASPHCHFIIACRLLLPTDIAIRDELMQTVERQGIERNVHFLGEVTDFPSLLRASDLFLFPVTNMTGKIDTPLTVIEAMAAGLPLVVSDIPPLNELFRAEVGITVSPGDDDATVAALLNLVENAERRAAYGHCAQKVAVDHYDVDRMVADYETLYRQLAKVTG